MNINYKILSASLAAMLAYEISSKRRMRKRGTAAINDLSEFTLFLANKIDEEGIEMTEFDKVIIRSYF